MNTISNYSTNYFNLYSTYNSGSINFTGAKIKSTLAKKAKNSVSKTDTGDFITKLLTYKDKNGKALLSEAQAKKLIKICKHTISNPLKPIENYQEKIEAVLNNPEEIAEISRFENRVGAIWQAIQEPLDSTKKANQKLFSSYIRKLWPLKFIVF